MGNLLRTVSVMLGFTVLVWSQPLRVGRSSVKITPPVGVPMGSSYGLTISQGIRDDLFAKALVLESGGTRAALVACDLISLRPELVAETREQITRLTGLNAQQVMLNATHTHCGPQLHAPFLDLVGGPEARLGREYRAQLPGRIADAVRLAIADLRPARAWAGKGQETTVAFNRRFRMKDGAVRMNPGRRNPNIVRPAAGIDPDVHVLYFDTPDGKPLAAHVNYALHVAVAGGNRFTADYPGTLSSLLSAAKGHDLLTLFTIGTAGDINHINVNSTERPDSLAESERIGGVIAREVLRVLRELEPVPNTRIGVRRERLQLPPRALLAGDAEKAPSLFARYGSKDAPPFHDVVWAWRVLDVAALRGRPLNAEVQVISLGDRVAWVGLPGEIFVDLGLAVKRASPFPHTVVSGMSASGTISYVPTRKAFEEGSYEVISARVAPGGGELLVEAAVRMLQNLSSQKPPRLPRKRL